MDPPTVWEVPIDLVNFQQTCPAPVYIRSCSKVNSKALEIAALVLETLARSSQRSVLSAEWGGLKKEKLVERTRLVDGIIETVAKKEQYVKH